MNENINAQINDIRETIINDAEECDENRINHFNNIDKSKHTSPAIEHMMDMRETLLDEYTKEAIEFSQLLDKKYGD